MSSIVTIDPAIGLTSSQTWDPPPPVEYGRQYSFSSGTDAGKIDSTTGLRGFGKAYPGIYVFTLPTLPGPITNYRVQASAVEFQQYDTFTYCSGGPAVPGIPWQERQVVARNLVYEESTTTTPKDIKIKISPVFQDIEHCTGSASSVSTEVNFFELLVDNVSKGFAKVDRNDDYYDPGGGSGFTRNRQAQLFDLSVELWYDDSSVMPPIYNNLGTYETDQVSPHLLS